MPAPFHEKLPVEIVQHIFKLCAPPGETKIGSADAKTLPALTHVCRSWRYLALAMPELWAGVSVSMSKGENARKVAIASKWLRRSGSRLKSLTVLNFCDHYSPAFIVQDLILPFRFRKLHLTLPFHQLQQVFLLPTEIFINLEYLRIYVSDGAKQAMWPPMFHPYTKLPLLRSMIISGRWTVPYLKSALSSCHHLQILRLHAHIPVSMALDILCSIPLLEQCSIAITRDDNPLDMPATTEPFVVLRNLIVLQVEWVRVEAATPFFSHLTVPALRKLINRCEAYARFSAVAVTYSSALVQLLERSRPNELSELRIFDPLLSFHIGDLIRHAPAIKFVYLWTGTVIDEAVVQSMSTGLVGSNLVDIIIMSTDDPQQFLRMVEVRQRSAKRHPEDQSKIKALQSIGVTESLVNSFDQTLLRSLDITLSSGYSLAGYCTGELLRYLVDDAR